MSLSNEEAAASLAAVEEVRARCRRSAAAGGAPFLIVWGGVWIVGYSALYLFGRLGGWVFLGFNAVGIVASVYLGVTWDRRAPVQSPLDRKLLWRIAVFWASLFAFIWLSLWVMGPSSALRASAYVSIAIMFAYIVLGLWIDAVYITWVGVGVIVMTVLGMHAVPRHFNLWMAVFGGGAMLGTGLYVHRYWR